jgi:hypothetical protein
MFCSDHLPYSILTRPIEAKQRDKSYQTGKTDDYVSRESNHKNLNLVEKSYFEELARNRGNSRLDSKQLK